MPVCSKTNYLQWHRNVQQDKRVFSLWDRSVNLIPAPTFQRNSQNIHTELFLKMSAINPLLAYEEKLPLSVSMPCTELLFVKTLVTVVFSIYFAPPF